MKHKTKKIEKSVEASGKRSSNLLAIRKQSKDFLACSEIKKETKNIIISHSFPREQIYMNQAPFTILMCSLTSQTSGREPASRHTSSPVVSELNSPWCL